MHFQDNCILVVNAEKQCMGSFLCLSQHPTVYLLHTIQMYRTFPLTHVQRGFFFAYRFCLIQGSLLQYCTKNVVVTGLQSCGFAHEKVDKKKWNTWTVYHPPGTYNISKKNKLLLWTVDCLREQHLQPRERERLWLQCENRKPCRYILPLDDQRYCSPNLGTYFTTCITFKGKVQEE